MLKASIDIGSNSTLLLICDVNIEQNIIVEKIFSQSIVTGLGRSLDDGKVFVDEAMNDTYLALKEYLDIIKKHNVPLDNVTITATEASRVAKNADEFYKEIKDKLGISVKVITSAAEAYYSTLGVLLGIDKEDDLTIIDIGGASTEIIVLKGRKMHTSFSMPVGSVRFKNWVEKGELEQNIIEIKTSFQKQLNSIKTNQLYCVAGTMTSIANMHLQNPSFNEEEVHGHEMTIEDLVNLKSEIYDLDTTELKLRFPFLGKRSETIKAGLDLILRISLWLNVDKYKISTYGLRYGTLVEGGIKDEFIYRK